MMRNKQLKEKIKPFLHWAILGGTLFFLIKVLKDHWEEVVSLRIEQSGFLFLGMGLGITLIAHIWTGWVWSLILRVLDQPASGLWGILVYLKTNIAKYLPGNVWHFYGRVSAAQAVGFSLAASTLSILIEALLMAASALTIALLSLQQSSWGVQAVILAGVLAAVHPRILNPLLQVAARLKRKGKSPSPEETAPSEPSGFQVKRYPLAPLLGEFVFVGLRGSGFLLTFLALSPIDLNQIPLLIGVFGLAWLLGLVIPGAPGGIGVFEATAVGLLQSHFPVGIVLGAVALYRLVSTAAEALGAGLAWLYEALIYRSSDSNLKM
jgi:glycosyltransferase 2 family protein